MIAAFRSICLEKFGDLGQIRIAARAAGFHPVFLDDPLPQSLVSRRGDLVLVYRGAADGTGIPIPQCHVEMPPPAEFEYAALIAQVESELGLGHGTSDATRRSSYTNWAWHDGSNRALHIALIAQILAGEPTFMLGVSPAPPSGRPRNE
jgi:hypothetical protein